MCCYGGDICDTMPYCYFFRVKPVQIITIIIRVPKAVIVIHAYFTVIEIGLPSQYFIYNMYRDIYGENPLF